MNRTRPSAAAPLFELQVLGTLGLRRVGGAELSAVIAQPKRIALLAYLALARPSGFHTRDKLVALFWPEMEEERARAALSQSLYVLRRALGADVVLSRGAGEVGLAAGAVLTDAETFERTLAASGAEAAMEHYRGHLLEGFHVAGAGGFDDWLEGERNRLRDTARRAAWSLVDEAQDSEHASRAAYWAQRAYALSPRDEGELQRLIEALDHAADFGGALAAYEDFARWLQKEYETEPAEHTRWMVARVLARQRAAASASEVDADAPQPVTAPDTTPVEIAAAEPAPSSVPSRARVWPRSTRMRALGAASAVIAIIAAITIVSNVRRDARLAAADPQRIAVLPFSVQAGPEYAYLAEGMVNLLSATLDGAGPVRTVDPRALMSAVERRASSYGDLETARAVATELGAGLYIVGSLVDAGGRLHATAAIYDVGGRRHAQASAIARDDDDVLGMVDDLARELLREHFQGPVTRLQRVAVTATASLPALKAFLAGEAHYRAARYEDAFDAYRHAVTLDSTFALAHFRVALVADWVDASSYIAPSIETARRFAHRLDDHERQLIEAFSLYWLGASVEGEVAYADLLRVYPDDIEAWHQYGELLFHQGPFLGRPPAAARTAFERVLALQPNHLSALGHLVRIAALEGDARGVELYAQRALAISPDGARLPELRLLRSVAVGDSTEFRRLLAQVTHEADYPVWVAAWRVAAYTRDFAAAIAILEADNGPTRAPMYRATNLLSIAHLEAARGRWKAAMHAAEAAESLDADASMYTRAFLAALPFAPMSTQDAPLLTRVQRALATSVQTRLLPASERTAIAGLLAARLGDMAAADAALAQLARMRAQAAAPLLGNMSGALRAAIAHAANDSVLTRAALDSLVTFRPSFANQVRGPTYTYALEHFLRAALLARAGRSQEALDWYATFGDDFGYDVVFVAPAHLRRAEILDVAGRNAEAARAYDRFVELWRDCDFELQPIVEVARARARALRAAQ